MSRTAINAARARELRAMGLTHRDAGIVLANEAGRGAPYTEGSVLRAIRDAERAQSHRETANVS